MAQARLQALLAMEVQGPGRPSVSFRQQRMIFWNNHALLPKAYIHFVTPRHRKETKLTL
jgi:hypothetical protein